MRAGAEAARATILGEHFHKFSPAGVSGMLFLAESHLSLHTWPECGYAAMDIYTCGQHAAPHNAIRVLAEALEAQHVEIVEMQRGVPADGKYAAKQLKRAVIETRSVLR